MAFATSAGPYCSQRASACSEAVAMLSESISKCRRSASRVSLRAKDLAHARAGAEERHASSPCLLAGLEEVDPADNPVFDARGHRGLRVVLVVQGEVVEDVLAVPEHSLDAVAHDDGGLVCERR